MIAHNSTNSALSGIENALNINMLYSGIPFAQIHQRGVMGMNPVIRHRSGLGANQYYIQVLTIFTSVGIIITLAIPPLLKRFHLGGMTAFWFLTCAFFVAYAFLGICFYARAVYDRRLRRAAHEGKIEDVK